MGAGHDVSIVIPVRENAELTRVCAESVFARTDASVELLLVDNGSGPEVGELAIELARRHAVRWIRNESNEGFGFACNQGMAAATADRVLLLNNDVVVTDGWYDRLSAALESSPDVGMAGPRSNRVSGPQLIAGCSYRDDAGLGELARRVATDAAGQVVDVARLVGLCTLIRREVLDDVGGFDPCFWLGNFEDDDLSLRALRKGWRLVIAADAFIHHEGSATFRRERFDWGALMEENWDWFRAKYDYAGSMAEPYPARELADQVSFDGARDFVPLTHERVFHPDADPMPLSVTRPRCALLFADARHTAWLRVASEWLTAHVGDPDVALLLRAEPHFPETIDRLQRHAERLASSFGAADVPDVLFDSTPLAPRDRGGLYTAATELLLAGGPRDALYRREAAACALPAARYSSAKRSAPA